MLTAAIAVIVGCNKNGTDPDKEDYVVSSSANTLTLTLDNPVEACWITDGNNVTIEGILSEDGESIDCTGEWFSAKVNLDTPKAIIFTVDENTSGEDRTLKIVAYHMGKSGSMTIKQQSN